MLSSHNLEKKVVSTKWLRLKRILQLNDLVSVLEKLSSVLMFADSKLVSGLEATVGLHVKTSVFSKILLKKGKKSSVFSSGVHIGNRSNFSAVKRDNVLGGFYFDFFSEDFCLELSKTSVEKQLVALVVSLDSSFTSAMLELVCCLDRVGDSTKP